MNGPGPPCIIGPGALSIVQVCHGWSRCYDIIVQVYVLYCPGLS